MSRLAFLLALMCGCHQVFGLVRDEDSDAGPGEGDDAKSGCWASEEDGDEDHDLMIDGCDRCPADVDAAIADTDGDLVGDQCDPALGPENRIVMFDGFATKKPWTSMGGAWLRMDPNDGEFVQELLSPTFAYAELVVPPVKFPTVDVRLVPDSACGNACGAGAELVYPFTRVACIYEYRNGSDQLAIYVNEAMVASAQLDAPGAIGIRLSALPNAMVQCQAFAGSAGAPLVAGVMVPSATTTVGLVTKGDTARFRSITVIASP